MNIYDKKLNFNFFLKAKVALIILSHLIFLSSSIKALVIVVPDLVSFGQHNYAATTKATNDTIIRNLEASFSNETTFTPRNTAENISLSEEAEYFDKRLNCGRDFIIFDWSNKAFISQQLSEISENFTESIADNSRKLLQNLSTMLSKEICLPEYRIIVAILLTLKIIKLSLEKPINDISLVGIGVNGSQIVHAISHLIVKPQRDFGISLAIQLIIALINVLPLGDIEKACLEAGQELLDEALKSVMQRCIAVLGYNPEMWDLAKKVVDNYYGVIPSASCDNLSQIHIAKMFTVGATFIKGSIQPNFNTIGKYYNFYSSSDVSKCFGHNKLQFPPLPFRADASNGKPLGNDVTNFEVHFSKQDSCYWKRCAFFAPNHDRLINSSLLHILIRDLALQSTLPNYGNFVSLFIAPGIGPLEIAYDVSPINQRGLSFNFCNLVTKIFCCGCVYSDQGFLHE